MAKAWYVYNERSRADKRDFPQQIRPALVQQNKNAPKLQKVKVKINKLLRPISMLS